jgi:hypothetical protein
LTIYRNVPGQPHFERYLGAYLADPPFKRPEQLRLHTQTIALKHQLGTIQQAIDDDGFLQIL